MAAGHTSSNAQLAKTTEKTLSHFREYEKSFNTTQNVSENHEFQSLYINFKINEISDLRTHRISTTHF